MRTQKGKSTSDIAAGRIQLGFLRIYVFTTKYARRQEARGLCRAIVRDRNGQETLGPGDGLLAKAAGCIGKAEVNMFGLGTRG